jgi:hypothetical protein
VIARTDQDQLRKVLMVLTLKIDLGISFFWKWTWKTFSHTTKPGSLDVNKLG